jgi:hypothetical protein
MSAHLRGSMLKTIEENVIDECHKHFSSSQNGIMSTDMFTKQ